MLAKDPYPWLLLVLSLLASSLGQLPQGVVLNGAVILNEVGGTPLVGVSVSADGANDTKTKLQADVPASVSRL